MPRVAVAQFSGSRNHEENAAAVERLTARAVGDGAQLLCFHELANTVYLPFAEDRELFSLAESEDGWTVRAARGLARRHGIVLVYPFFERDGERYFNTAIVFGTAGETLGKYRKTSVPTSRLLPGANERFFFAPGDLGFPVVQTPFGVRVGLIICYDRNLPEPARCAALNGTDLLFVPVTTTTKVLPWWELLLRARAVENVFYVAAPSRVGADRGGAPEASYIGMSLIVDPRGEIVARGNDAGEDVVCADLDLELLERQRQLWTFFQDRRPDQYGVLTGQHRPAGR
ncbi:MAG: nitrilase-related carbon-nitrogen hydrolase [Candidatus Binatia bacterium]